MSRFAYDFHRLVNDTHHARRNAIRQGFLKGALLGAAIGYMFENFQQVPLPWGLTVVLALLVWIIKSYSDREAVILTHLTHFAGRYDHRLLPLLRNGVPPELSVKDERTIVEFAVSAEASNYEKWLLKSISPSLHDKIEQRAKLQAPLTVARHQVSP